MLTKTQTTQQNPRMRSWTEHPATPQEQKRDAVRSTNIEASNIPRSIWRNAILGGSCNNTVQWAISRNSGPGPKFGGGGVPPPNFEDIRSIRDRTSVSRCGSNTSLGAEQMKCADQIIFWSIEREEYFLEKFGTNFWCHYAILVSSDQLISQSPTKLQVLHAARSSFKK